MFFLGHAWTLQLIFGVKSKAIASRTEPVPFFFFWGGAPFFVRAPESVLYSSIGLGLHETPQVLPANVIDRPKKKKKKKKKRKKKKKNRPNFPEFHPISHCAPPPSPTAMPYRAPKCDVIKNIFSAFSLFFFLLHISVEHDEKPPHTKFDMNRFMVAQDIWPHEYLISPIEISVNWPGS